LVTWLSTTGVALGVLALVGGFSITTGFEQAFREKVLGLTAHVLVREFGIRFSAYRDVTTRLENLPGVKASSPMTFNEAMISSRGGSAGVVIKGLLPESAERVLELPSYIKEGPGLSALEEQEGSLESIILGAELARRIGAERGDVITLLSPLRDIDPREWKPSPGTPKTGNFRVVGLFEAGFQEYDSRLAYLKLSVAQKFFGTGDNVVGVEVAVDDPLKAGVVAQRIRDELKMFDYQVRDWRQQNKNLFSSLMYQRLAILVVLSVMVVLAACNVAAMLIMLVLERTKEISILKAMGVKDKSILGIFVLEGLGIGLIGTLAGLLLAYAFCEGLLANGIALDPTVYGIARLPVIFDPLDYLMAGGGAMLITLTATIFPALRAARLQPVEGLRETYG